MAGGVWRVPDLVDCSWPYWPLVADGEDVASMSGLDWFFSITLGIIYIALLFTVMVVTFRKGHWVLGLIGFFIPVLWLIGAILPSKRR